MSDNPYEQTPLTGPYANPLASNPQPISNIERVFQQRRSQAQANLGQGRGAGLQVWNGPAGLNDAGAHWRNVQDNELSGTRLAGLLDRGGSYIQGARSRVGRAAAARGAFNTNQALAEGEAAAIDRAGEFAMQEANAFGTAAQQNQDAFNQMRIAQEGNETNIATASISAGATIGAAQIRASTDLIQQDRDNRWRDRDRDTRRGQDRDDANRDRGWGVEDRDSRQNHDINVLREGERINNGARLQDFIVANPDLWSNPTAMQGFRNLMAELFPAGSPIGGSGSVRPPGTPPGPPASVSGQSFGNQGRPTGGGNAAPNPIGMPSSSMAGTAQAPPMPAGLPGAAPRNRSGSMAAGGRVPLGYRNRRQN